MEHKPKKNMGLSLLAVAFLFLFEPGYALWDFLPDLIGYILLCVAILDLADLNPRISDAFIGFRWGILLSALRCMAIYLIYYYFTEAKETLWVLTLVFAFELFELILLLPAYKNLFEGLLFLGMMHDGSATHAINADLRCRRSPDSEKKKIIAATKGSRNVSERLLGFTNTYLILSALCMLLPELTALINNENYEFILILRVFGILISLGFGIAWFVQMQKYLSNIRKDRLFLQNLNKLYHDKAIQNSGFYLSRVLRVGMMVLFAGILCFADFYVNYQNVIPVILGYALLILGALMLMKYVRNAKWVIFTSAAGALLTLYAGTVSANFYNRFEPIGVRRDLEIYNAFYQMAAIEAVSAVLAAISLILTVLLARELYLKYTDASRAIIAREHIKKCNLYAIFSGISALLTTGASIYYILAQPFYEVRDGKVISEGWYFYYSGFISVIVNLIGIICVCSFFAFVYHAIKEQYEISFSEN